MSKYENPKKFSLEINKLIERKKTKLNLYSILFMLDDLKGNLLKPEKLRNYLDDKLVNSQSDAICGLPVESKIDEINSRDLRQYVFKNLEYFGYLQNYRGNDYCKKFTKNQRGRPSPETSENRGGNPSVYKLDDTFDYYKSLVEKPECINYLFDKLKNSKFFKAIIKYQLKAGLYMGEINRNTIFDALNVPSEVFKIRTTQEIEYIKANPALVNTIIDSHIDELVELSMSHLETHKKHFCKWVLALGLKSDY